MPGMVCSMEPGGKGLWQGHECKGISCRGDGGGCGVGRLNPMIVKGSASPPRGWLGWALAGIQAVLSRSLRKASTRWRGPAFHLLRLRGLKAAPIDDLLTYPATDRWRASCQAVAKPIDEVGLLVVGCFNPPRAAGSHSIRPGRGTRLVGLAIIRRETLGCHPLPAELGSPTPVADADDIGAGKECNAANGQWGIKRNGGRSKRRRKS